MFIPIRCTNDGMALACDELLKMGEPLLPAGLVRQPAPTRERFEASMAPPIHLPFSRP